MAYQEIKKMQNQFLWKKQKELPENFPLKKKNKKQKAGSIALMEILAFPQRADTANFT